MVLRQGLVCARVVEVLVKMEEDAGADVVVGSSWRLEMKGG